MTLESLAFNMITPIMIALLTSSGLWTILERRSSHQKNTDKLMLGLARSAIIKEYEYYIKKGHISSQEYDDLIIYLYEPYKKLGGDGMAERLVKELNGLPSSKE